MWGIPVGPQWGLQPYEASWNSLVYAVLGKPEVWEGVQAQWKEVYGEGMLDGFDDPAVKSGMEEMMAIYTSPQGPKLSEKFLELMRSRPRTVTTRVINLKPA